MGRTDSGVREAIEQPLVMGLQCIESVHGLGTTASIHARKSYRSAGTVKVNAVARLPKVRRIATSEVFAYCL